MLHAHESRRNQRNSRLLGPIYSRLSAFATHTQVTPKEPSNPSIPASQRRPSHADAGAAGGGGHPSDPLLLLADPHAALQLPAATSSIGPFRSPGDAAAVADAHLQGISLPVTPMSALDAVPRGLASSPSPPAGPLRVCVVGAGSISREFALHHFGAPTATVVRAVVDVDLERARQLAVDVGSVQAGAAVADSGGSRYRAVAAEVRGEAVPHASALSSAVLEGVDCVYVGTTPAAHAPLVLAALAAGKHVLLEKPLAATAADADAIVAAAEEAQSRRGL
jgi:hypothetical protein